MPGSVAGPLTKIDRTTPMGVRDAAIILLGYASAMRLSELVALTLLDVAEKPDGLLVTIRRSNTDRVAALAAWRELRGHHPGPLFTRLFHTRISLHARAWPNAGARGRNRRGAPGGVQVPDPRD